MKRIHDRREEVIRQNRLAAASQAGGAMDDPEAMFVLELAVGGSEQRIYELSLGRVIARLAEELAAMEVEIEALRHERAKEKEAVRC